MNEDQKVMRRIQQFFLFVAEVILLYKLAKEFSLELVVSIGIVSFLFMLTLIIEKVESLSLTKGGIKADMRELQEKIEKSEEKLYRLISLSMGEHTYKVLKLLANGELRKFEKPHHQGLEMELYYLRNLGYVERINKSVNSIYDIPEEGQDLSKYIEITDNGRKYVDLREGMEDKV